MKVAISQSVGPGEGSDSLRHSYTRFFASLGVLLIPVSNALDDPVAYVEALDVDGLVLAGGGDVDPARYGAANTHSTEIAPERDATELALLGWAAARGKPVVGICRGMQVINVHFGGALVQDIPALVPGARAHQDSAHAVAVTDARLADALGTRALEVNSFHHQAVTAATCAPDLDALALSAPDGVIEALWHRTLPVLGVQWHPERPGPSERTDRGLLRAALDGSLWHARV